MKNEFEIGQRLWPIQRPAELWKVNPPFDLQIIQLAAGGLSYGFTHKYGFLECDVFASEQDARAECDRRNGRAVSSIDQLTDATEGRR